MKIANYSIAGTIEIVNEDERTAFGEFKIYQTDGRSMTQLDEIEEHLKLPEAIKKLMAAENKK